MTTMTTKLDVSGGMARSRRAGEDFWKSIGHCETPASQNSRFVAFVFTQRFKIPVTWTGAKLQSTLEMQIFQILFFESND